MINALGMSLATVLMGYVLSFGIGILLALLCSLSRRTRAFILPVANLCRPVSAIALYPAIIMLIGIGYWARVFVLAWVSLPVVLINTLHALDTVNQEIIDAARLETDERHILYHVRFPISAKSIIATLNITISTTWIGLTSAEMLGASDGLGFKILEAAQSFNYPVMWTYILMVAGVGYVMSYLVSNIYKKMEHLQ